MAIIFEEHAKLEWRAPAIDGRVCRLWRQIALNAPRAWTYLEISHEKPPTTSMLLSWLDRSRTALLHITVDMDFPLSDDINTRTLYELLRDYHTRIASLRMYEGILSFFERLDFPCMRLLEVVRVVRRRYSPPSVLLGHMPKLRSLRMGHANPWVTPLESLAPLKVLVLYYHICTSRSLLRHSTSLVTLMLHSVTFQDTILGSINFPSLTYLSLNTVSGLKPHINAPSLVTFHEAADTHETFSSPVPSLMEYGLRAPYSHPHPTTWHSSFPNILRLSIRAGPLILIPLLETLSIQPHILPALQMISAGFAGRRGAKFSEKEQEAMESSVRLRSERCHLDVALYFEPSHIPLFFGNVSH